MILRIKRIARNVPSFLNPKGRTFVKYEITIHDDQGLLYLQHDLKALTLMGVFQGHPDVFKLSMLGTTRIHMDGDPFALDLKK